LMGVLSDHARSQGRISDATFRFKSVLWYKKVLKGSRGTKKVSRGTKKVPLPASGAQLRPAPAGLSPCQGRLVPEPRKVDIRLPGEGNSNSHGARPVY